MSKHPLSAEAFHEILHRGRLDEIIAAARAGTEMHPELPDHLVRDPGCVPVLSPLGMAWRWDWAKRPEKCLEAVRALIEAGADPDAPDEGDYQPLHALLFTWKADLPVEATKVLLQAGADPSMSTATPDQVRPLAMEVCIAHVLPHHARALLEHDPQQAILCAGNYTVLECLARVGDR